MMIKDRRLSSWQILLILILGISLTGCPTQMVSHYDSTTVEDIVKVGKKVDHFYGHLLDTTSSRPYQTYADQYQNIEVALRSLVNRNRERPLNAEATEIFEIVLTLWMKNKATHETKNGYANSQAILDRGRFIRLLLSAANEKLAKQLDPQDKDASKASKNLPPLGL